MAGKCCRPWLCQRQRRPEVLCGSNFSANFFGELFPPTSLLEVLCHESDLIYSKNSARSNAVFPESIRHFTSAIRRSLKSRLRYSRERAPTSLLYDESSRVLIWIRFWPRSRGETRARLVVHPSTLSRTELMTRVGWVELVCISKR